MSGSSVGYGVVSDLLFAALSERLAPDVALEHVAPRGRSLESVLGRVQYGPLIVETPLFETDCTIEALRERLETVPLMMISRDPIGNVLATAHTLGCTQLASMSETVEEIVRKVRGFVLGTLTRLPPLPTRHTAARVSDSLSDRLTHRQLEVARCVAEGLTNREIATRLGVSVDTVKEHVAAALQRTTCTSRTQLGVLIAKAGLA